MPSTADISRIVEKTSKSVNVMFGEVNLPIIIETGKVRGFTLFVDDFVERDGYEFSKLLIYR